MKNRISNRRRLQLESLEQRQLLAADLSLQLVARNDFLPGVPVLIHAELADQTGETARDQWDATVELTSSEGSFTAEPLQLVNGRGSTLVTLEDAVDITLQAQWRELATSVQLSALVAPPVQNLSGELESDLTVSGVIRIERDLIIPTGVELTIAAGSLILLDGAADSQTGTQIVVQGTLRSLGNEEQPITLTAADPSQPWGQIDVDGGSVEFNHTFLTRAGSSPRGGHTNTGPALRLRDDGFLSLSDSSISDINGKILQASSGQLEITGSLLSRAVMGPEIKGTGLAFNDSWITDMAGRFHHNGKVDDNDGIYLHGQKSGQQIEINSSVVAGVQDDAIDTLGSIVTVRDTIVRDAADKAVSAFNGAVTIERGLIVNSAIGVETKGSGSSTPDTTIRQSTIANVDLAISSRDKGSPDPNVLISYDISNSILHVNPGGQFIRSDYDPADLHINYSLLGQLWNHDGSGTGNLSSPPGFVDATTNNFRLQPDSAAIDQGDPQASPDPDGTRIDIGYYSFRQSALVPGDFNGDQKVDTVDVDLFCRRINENPRDSQLDLDNNGSSNQADFAYLIDTLLGSTFGDSNLDQVFDSSDLVQVFQNGHYEDDLAGNSGWAQGDWNCDGEFDSADLVTAFQAGGYENPKAAHVSLTSAALAAALDAKDRKEVV
ncbi:MAG: dockerin type I domain-containing protein [Pirellulaceae bacterium]|nr:dockerin type I domain-containing protein [Pirellulaceae bacterium]